jgi:hypothetical protein
MDVESMQLMNGTLEHRMKGVESGLKDLDTKVTVLDRKIDHLGNVQMEMFDDQTRMGNEFKSQLQEQRDELVKWQREVKHKMGGRCQFYTMLVAICGWLMFMIHYYWHLDS